MEALAAIHAPSSLICKSAFSNKSCVKRTIKAEAVKGNKLHSIPPDKVEIFKNLDSWAGDNILPLLIPVEKSWQPQDLLPCASSESFFSDIRELRARARELSDEYFVCLVGDMITEEALPTYQTMLNTFDGVKDETASSNTSWATWTRAWSSEENRHGDVLSNYLYLSGRVDMKQIQKTIHYLISSGMDAGLENNPYLGFVYTSFQERATAISHGNTARMAKEKGDTALAKLCGKVAADEKRHEKAYQRIVRKLLEVDPNETLCAISTMLRKKITMPAHFMFDGKDSDLFNHYSAVAQRIGVYTAWDYAEIVEHLIETWGLEKLEDGLDFKGRDARDFVCNHPRIVRRLAERAQVRSSKMKGGDLMLPFSWIFDREASIS